MTKQIVGGDRDLPYDEAGRVSFEAIKTAMEELTASIMARGGSAPEFEFYSLTTKPCLRVRGIAYVEVQ